MFVRDFRRHDAKVETKIKAIGAVTATLSILLALIKFLDAQQQHDSSQVQAEYIRATQLLGQPRPSPMSDILAMSELAQNDRKRTWQMTEALSAFIRDKATIRHAQIAANSPRIYTPCDARDPRKNKDRSRAILSPQYGSYLDSTTQMALNALAYRSRQKENPEEHVPEHLQTLCQAARHLF